MVDFKDYYGTLGVPKTASEADIKKAYRTLARKYHPDVNPGDKAAEAKFKEINEANEVLGDPGKRRKYDELGANWRAYEQAQAAGGPQGATDWAAHFGGAPGGGGGSYRTMTPEEMEHLFGGQDPFSDFFHTFFGGGGFSAGTGGGARGRARSPSRAGRDVESPIDLTLEDAMSGTTRRLVMQQPDGTERTIEVRIPAGVKDGARVRAAGEGEAGARGGKSGDLYLVVRLQPHARFERRGQDLYTHADVPVTTAVLGGDVAVATLTGSTLRVKIPEMTRGGRTFRLRGHGLPAVGKPDERGDLYVTADVQIPAQLSDEQRKLYESLRALETS